MKKALPRQKLLSCKIIPEKPPYGIFAFGNLVLLNISVFSLSPMFFHSPLPQHGYSKGVWGHIYIWENQRRKRIFFPPSLKLPCVIALTYFHTSTTILTRSAQSSSPSFSYVDLTKSLQSTVHKSVLQRYEKYMWNMDMLWNINTNDIFGQFTLKHRAHWYTK